MKEVVYLNEKIKCHQKADIEDPAFAEQFEDVLEHLVTKCPVAHSEVGPGYHVFNRYKDVRRCAKPTSRPWIILANP